MTTTYKLLKQYFLDRDDTTTGGGNYYYGSGGPQTNNSDFNNSFNSIEVDQRFEPESENVTFNVWPDIVAVQGNKVIARTTGGELKRYSLESGAQDYSFSEVSIGGGDLYGILIMPDNKILLFGAFSSVAGQSISEVAMLNEDGTFDANFQPLTFVRASLPGEERVYNASLVSSDKILLTGYFSSVNGVSRTNSAMIYLDGSLDTSFNISAIESSPFDIGLQNDGKILISNPNTSIVRRFYSDGTLDSTMNTISFGNDVNYIKVQPDEKILVSGVPGVKRYNSNGSIDTSFGTSGFVSVSGRYGRVYNLELQDDNKILISGSFTSVDGTAADGLARLNTDGSVDTSFVSPALNYYSEINKSIYVSISLPNKKILISGRFSALGGGRGNGLKILKEKINNAPYQLVYTVPSSTSTIIGRSFVTNHNNFPVYYDIAIVPYEDDTVSSRHHIVWDKELSENNFDVIKDKITLSSGDKVYVYSSTDEKLSFNIFGTEITA